MLDTPPPLRRQVAVALFADAAAAEETLERLRAAGFRPDQVSAVTRDVGEGRELAAASEHNDELSAAATATAATVGGLTGGLAGWLIGIGALTIPGLGPVIAAGALATTLGGAALGATAGGLVVALVAYGMPEATAREYEDHVEQGRVLLAVFTDGPEQAEQARTLLEGAGGQGVMGFEGSPPKPA